MIENGMIEVGVKESDWILGGTFDAVDLAPIVDDIRMTDNQYSRLDGKLRMACTMFNPMMLICSIYNYEPSEQFRETYRNYAQREYGYKEGVGNYSSTGVDCARSYRNDLFPEKAVVSFRVNLLSAQAEIALDKGYGITVSYRGNKQYNSDYQSDNVLNEESFGSYTYGHCTSMYIKDGGYYIYDSADGRPYNIYEIESPLENLIKNDVYYGSCYIMVPDPNNEIAEAQKRFEAEYQEGFDLGITTIPYVDATDSKREMVVQDVRVYNLIKNS